jgi:hypothetical protein
MGGHVGGGIGGGGGGHALGGGGGGKYQEGEEGVQFYVKINDHNSNGGTRYKT